jgi:hypothetical protein
MFQNTDQLTHPTTIIANFEFPSFLVQFKKTKKKSNSTTLKYLQQMHYTVDTD